MHLKITTALSRIQRRSLQNSAAEIIFSKIDLNDAYFQIPVDEECSKLLCINTHRGLFNFERLPFGVKATPAIL